MSGQSDLVRAAKKLRNYDNLYVIEKRCGEALRSPGRVSQSYRDALKKLLEDADWQLGTGELKSCVADYSRGNVLSDRELCSTNDVIARLVLKEIVRCEYEDGKYCERLERCVKTLRFIDNYDFDELYAELSPLEAALRQSAPCYAACDEATARTYRRHCTLYARRHGIPEAEAARILGESAGLPEAHPLARRLYFPVVCALTLLFTALACALTRSVLFALLVLIPMSELAKWTTDTALGRLIPAEPLPRLALENIPDGAETLVVVTTLLFSGGHADELASRVERFYLANRGKNVCFGVLGDLKDSPEAETPADAGIISAVTEKIQALNEKYGGGFCLLTRGRVRCPGEKRYFGWERKRGAVVELTRLVAGKPASLRVSAGDIRFIESVKYVVTLDADTDLGIGDVKRLVGTMLHPLNRPVLEGGVVTRGYAIMQPRMTVSLSSASRTPFAVMTSGCGGTDIYARASYDTYQSVFGEGSFCGKGIFDAEIFSRAIDGAFPEGSVLSHDLLEGARLRAAYASDVVLTDGCPKNPLSSLGRLHRWIRGDVQSLAFAGKYVKNERGERSANPISPLSRFKLYDNLRRILVPVSAAASLAASVFMPSGRAAALLLALAYILLPMLYALLSDLGSGAFSRRFRSRVLGGALFALSNALYNIASLFQLAFVSCDAVLRAAYRTLFSRKHMLEWVTASESELVKTGSTAAYVYKMLPSVIAGGALCFVSSPLHRLLGLMWISLPFVSRLLSSEFPEAPDVAVHDGSRLREYSKRAWEFYETFADESNNWLPPDNYQLAHTERVAFRTSPTNIGLYMLSALAARDFGFIGTEALCDRLTKVCVSLDGMSKWRGHLYNWYDTSTLEVLGAPYVSTVDSGNFITCLVALREGLAEYADEDDRIAGLVERLGGYIDGCDFRALYNPRRSLFLIGVNTSDADASLSADAPCYDLYMSECRTTSYYAVASGQVPPRHWSRLGRMLVSDGGYIGLASWSGTAFEYFMPALLLPVTRNSLEYEALCFALREQMSERRDRLWGRSESGYFAFDADMNYQYKAFGIQKLGLKRGLADECVISPYSSFLTLCFAPRESQANLERLKAAGLYGRYGFFEAVDFTRSRVGGGHAVIKSYMAHHVGMSIVAAANACFGNVFVRRFMRDPVAASAAGLLEERIPVGLPVSILPEPDVRMAPPTQRSVRRERGEFQYSADEPAAVSVSNNKCRIIAASDGSLRLEDGNVSLTYPLFGGRSGLRTVRLIFEADGELFDALRCPMSSDGERVEYRLDTPRFSARTTFTLSGRSSCFAVSLSVSGSFTELCPMLLLEPVLCPAQDFAAHPAYTALSIVSEYDADENILYFHKKSRALGGRGRWLAATLESGGGKIEFETRRDSLFGPLYGENDVLEACRAEFGASVGACINPICALKKRSSTKNGRYRCEFLVASADSREYAAEIIRNARRLKKSRGRRGISEVFAASLAGIAATQLATSGLDARTMKYAALAETAAVCGLNFTNTLTSPTTAESLWKHGISGDLPIVALEPDDEPNLSIKRCIAGFVGAHRYLTIKGLRFDLVILCRDSGRYGAPNVNSVRQIIRDCGSEAFLGGRGGIFIVSPTPDEAELWRSVPALYAAPNGSFSLEGLYRACMKRSGRPPLSPPPKVGRFRSPEYSIPDGALRTCGERGEASGYFSKKGFTVLKSAVRAPWSYVYASPQFGTLVTQNSLGFTWYSSSREGRLTPWSNDVLLDCQGERLVLEAEGERWDLCASADRAVFAHGCAEYTGEVVCGSGSRFSFRVLCGVDPKLPVKAVLAEVSPAGKVAFELDPVMGAADSRLTRAYRDDVYPDTLLFRGMYGSGIPHICGFLSSASFGGGKYGFLLGAFPAVSRATLDYVKRRYSSPEAFEGAFRDYAQKAERLFGSVSLDSGRPALDYMTNFYLPYQAVYVRMFARTGFYQSGGAHGFRDQLQDCLAALYYSPELVRSHIVRCAGRQFVEGDVLHWWHHSQGGDRGVRTRCSDDFLWLPYCAAEYVERTGDAGILKIKLPYIESRPLADGENERYERPSASGRSESLYMHCVRAVERAFRYGPHGFPLIGTCDWNDGFSAVGAGGRGESVWLGFFLRLVLKRFIPLCALMGDADGAEKYAAAEKTLADDLEKYGWDGDWYLRAFFDNGFPLGGRANSECRIDVLPQVFAALADGPTERARKALDSAYRLLFDPELRIFKLFAPPFTGHAPNPGYIAGYAEGVRENGGQYTHAAVWAALGFLAAGEASRGFEVLDTINPASADTGAYRVEPYCLAGDVYSNPSHPGRGGWTQYTGSAAWFVRVVLGELIGYREHGDHFTLEPKLSDRFDGFRLRIAKLGTVYNFTVRAEKGKSYTSCNGIVNNKYYFDKTEHFIDLTVEKK